MAEARPTAILNARLVDPNTGFDAAGGVLIRSGTIADAGPHVIPHSVSDDFAVIDAAGHALFPGLIDLRVSTGEPGAEHRETLKSAGSAAVAGGVTTIVVQPDTAPVIDDAAMVQFMMQRGRERSPARVLPAGALTRGLAGEQMAEIGLMQEAGAVLFSNGMAPVRDSRTMRRLLAYASGFEALVASRPVDPWLTMGAAMNEGELSARLGLAGAPAAAELIGLQRDLALAELTGGRLLVDMISTQAAIEPLARARDREVEAAATVSIHNLTLNETDVGDYRTFAKLDPPLRREDDRLALVEALRDGVIDVVVSGHDPRPAEDKRLPFAEAAAGASALESLLVGLLQLVHAGELSLIEALRPVTSAPADLLGLPQGRLKPGAPADLVLCDLGWPFLFDASAMRSKCKNAPFDGRRLQGRVLATWVGGTQVHEART